MSTKYTQVNRPDGHVKSLALLKAYFLMTGLVNHIWPPDSFGDAVPSLQGAVADTLGHQQYGNDHQRPRWGPICRISCALQSAVTVNRSHGSR